MIKILILILLFTTSAQCQKQETRQVFEFQFEGNTINGVLNLPEIAKPRGSVLIVHGSGRTNAIEQELHLDFRKSIINAGYATYMWDKMGCGKSEGTFDYNQTVQSSALEVIAAISQLKEKQIPGFQEIGLWGISRAGWIIPMVINQYKDIKFWISVSGVDDKENFSYLFKENLRIKGMPKDSIHLLVNELKDGYRICHAGESFESYMNGTKNLRESKFLKRFNNSSVITEKGYYEYQKSFMKEAFDEEANLQVYIENFDSILSSVTCPVLALFGENDMNVEWQKTKALYEKTMGENIDLTIKSFPNCNHNLFQCESGGFYEFQDNSLPWHRCDGVLETITNWIKKGEGDISR